MSEGCNCYSVCEKWENCRMSESPEIEPRRPLVEVVDGEPSLFGFVTVWVEHDDDEPVVFAAQRREDRLGVQLFQLDPDEAHWLGTKLRLAARKAKGS